MVKEVVQSCLIELGAMARNHTFGIALMMDGINTTVPIGKMQVWNVCARKVTLLMERDVLVCRSCTISFRKHMYVYQYKNVIIIIYLSHHDFFPVNQPLQFTPIH